MLGKQQAKIAFSAIIACMLWATAAASIKTALKYSPPLFLAGTRFLISGLFLIPFSGPIKKYLPTVWNNLHIIVPLSLFQTILLYAAFNIGMTLVPAAIGAIVVGASPLVTAVVSHYFAPDDKLTPGKILSVLVGALGIVLITISRQPLTSAGFRELTGIILIASGNVASAFGNIIVSTEKGKMHPILLNSAQIGLGGLILLISSVIFEQGLKIEITFPFILVLSWLSFISAAAFSIWFILLKTENVKVSELNMWKFIIPVCGAIFSWIILPNEAPNLYTVSGMLIVTISVFVYFKHGKSASVS
jgi:drug/metabolite transporter (DMT)-like permease